MNSANQPLLGFIPGPYAGLLDEYVQNRDLPGWQPLAPTPERLPMQTWRERLEHASAQLQDPLLGLHLGQSIRPAHFGVLGLVFHACTNMGAALARLERYQRLVYDFNPLKLHIGGQHVELIWSTERGRPGALVDECAISALVTLARHLSGTPLQPAWVHFVNPSPAAMHWPEYEQVLGRQVQFEQPQTVVAIPLDWLSLPLQHPDTALQTILEQQADALLAQLPEHAQLSARLTRLLSQQLSQGLPTQHDVAAQLGLSTRSLHRRLAAEGTSYRERLAQTRLQLAQSYLRNPQLHIAEVAQLCGYTEQSALSRAFKQWTGLSPQAYRRRR